MASFAGVSLSVVKIACCLSCSWSVDGGVCLSFVVLCYVYLMMSDGDVRYFVLGSSCFLLVS